MHICSLNTQLKLSIAHAVNIGSNKIDLFNWSVEYVCAAIIIFDDVNYLGFFFFFTYGLFRHVNYLPKSE